MDRTTVSSGELSIWKSSSASAGRSSRMPQGRTRRKFRLPQLRQRYRRRRSLARREHGGLGLRHDGGRRGRNEAESTVVHRAPRSARQSVRAVEDPADRPSAACREPTMVLRAAIRASRRMTDLYTPRQLLLADDLRGSGRGACLIEILADGGSPRSRRCDRRPARACGREDWPSMAQAKRELVPTSTLDHPCSMGLRRQRHPDDVGFCRDATVRPDGGSLVGQWFNYAGRAFATSPTGTAKVVRVDAATVAM